MSMTLKHPYVCTSAFNFTNTKHCADVLHMVTRWHWMPFATFTAACWSRATTSDGAVMLLLATTHTDATSVSGSSSEPLASGTKATSPALAQLAGMIASGAHMQQRDYLQLRMGSAAANSHLLNYFRCRGGKTILCSCSEIHAQMQESTPAVMRRSAPAAPGQRRTQQTS